MVTIDKAVERLPDNARPWFSALLAQSPFGIAVFNTEGCLQTFNQCFVELLGSTAEKLNGLDMLDIPDQRVVNAVKAAISGETTQLEINYTSVTSGKNLPVNAIFIPVKSNSGKVEGGIVVVEDLSRQREADSQSQRQLAFEKMVAQISKRLVNTPIELIDQAVNQTMREIGEFFDVDRCYIFQFDTLQHQHSNTHEWCSPGIEPQIDKLQGLQNECFPWMLMQIESQQILHLPDVSAMDDDVASERDFLLAQGIQSLLIIPMIENSQPIGFFGIDSVRARHDWPSDKIVLLQVVAETISNAFSRRAFEKALRKVNTQYQQFSAQVPLGLYTLRVNTEGVASYDYCNELFLQLNGVQSAAEVLAFAHVHPDDLADFQQRQQYAWRKQRAFVWEGRFILDGNVHWMRIEDAEPKKTKNGDLIWNGFQQDITERKHLEQRLKDLATIDDMTQLWNRRYFMQAAEEEFERAQRYGNGFSFLMVDADRFKAVNDEFGHAAGDAVLINLANVMKQSVRKVDVVGRLGGEEFAILLPNTPKAEAINLAERIRKSVEETPADYAGQTLPITISIGIACFDSQDSHLDQIIQRADKALYQAKNQGRNRCVFLD